MKYVYLTIGLLNVLIFWQLGLRPLEYDEGVNYWFLIHFRQYQYNPLNFHGPWLYYPQLLISGYAGVSPYVLRIGTALAGVLVLCGVAWATSEWGTGSMIFSVLLCGLSCDFLYYSRYFIHEIWFVLFGLGIYLGIFKKNFPLLAVSATLAFCTKETSVVSFGIMGAAVLLTSTCVDNRWVMPSLVLAAFIWATLYTTIFTHARGLLDSLRGPFSWLHSIPGKGSQQPFWYYLKMLGIYELPILICGIYGSIQAFNWFQDSEGLFLSYWAFGNVLVYSLIPYKMPWLILNMLIPMVLLSGYAIRGAPKFALAVILFWTFPWSLWKSYQVNFKGFDNPAYPQNYAQTSREIGEMVKYTGNPGLVKVLVKEYWPIPYYLRNLKMVEFWDTKLTDQFTPVLITQTVDREHYAELLKYGYELKTFHFRPGIELDVFKKGI